MPLVCHFYGMPLAEVADLTADQFLLLVGKIGKIITVLTPQSDGTGAGGQPAVAPNWDMIKQAKAATMVRGRQGMRNHGR